MYTDKVLILTPVKDAERVLENHIKSLYSLTYPHNLISVAFLESDSSDHTYLKLKKEQPELQRAFGSVSVWKKDFGFHIPAGVPKRLAHVQKERREVLARSRNHLLFHALEDEDWVLWLDVDVAEYPHDIIERLLSTGKDIVEPNCVLNYGGPSFDLNAWRDRGKYHLDDLRSEGELVKLDAVGGTILLVKADIHRDGLIFPPFPYGLGSGLIRKRGKRFLITLRELFSYSLRTRKMFRVLKKVDRGELLKFSNYYAGEIETEGLGIMAHDMGYECWGMPNFEVKHSKEPQ